MTKKEDVRSARGTSEERHLSVDRLTDEEREKIDRNLLENVAAEWSKVSRIVLTTMIEREEGVTGLPETFYCERVAHLAKKGLLDHRGDLSDMHASEVRLAEKS